MQRSYRVYVPEEVAETPALIIALHWASGTSCGGVTLRRIRRGFGLEGEA